MEDNGQFNLIALVLGWECLLGDEGIHGLYWYHQNAFTSSLQGVSPTLTTQLNVAGGQHFSTRILIGRTQEDTSTYSLHLELQVILLFQQ